MAMDRVPRSQLILAATIVGLGMTLAAAAETVFQQRPLTRFLESQNWIALSIPDNKMRPGAVIKVPKTDKVDVQWLGDFLSCGVTDTDFGLVRGKYPPAGVGENFAIKASFVADLL